MLRGFWTFIKKVLPYLLMLEGFDHYIFSTIAVVGLVAKHQYGFFIWFTPVMDYFLGTLTLVGGFIIRKRGQHNASTPV